MTNNIFINAQELADELGVSKAMAYKMIKGWNERLEQMGYSNALQCARLVTTLYSFGRTISIGNSPALSAMRWFCSSRTSWHQQRKPGILANRIPGRSL